MRTVRFAPIRPRKFTAAYWFRRGATFGRIGRGLGRAFALCVAAMLIMIVCGIASGLAIQILAKIFSSVT